MCGTGSEDNDLIETETLCMALRVTKCKEPILCHGESWKPGLGIHMLANKLTLMLLCCGHSFQFNQVVYCFTYSRPFISVSLSTIMYNCFLTWLTNALRLPSHLSFSLPPVLFENKMTHQSVYPFILD